MLALALPFRAITAHPRLMRSVPAAGSHLRAAPRELSLAFNQAVTVALCRLTLLDATQHPVALDSLRTALGDAKTLTVKVLGTLPPGRYSVKWQAGGADGHPLRGEYTFVVDPGAGGLPTGAMETPRPDGGASFLGSGTSIALRATHALIAPAVAVAALAVLRQTPTDAGFDVESPVYVAIRAIQSVALVGLLGLLALHMVVLPRFARQASSTGLRTVEAVEHASMGWARGMLWTIGVMTFARLAAQHAAFFGTGEAWTRSTLAALLLNSSWGRGWWLELAATVVGFLGTHRIGRAQAHGWPVLTVAAVAATTSVAMSGHAAAGSPTAMILHALHVLGAGGWIGGLAALMLVAVPTVLRLGSEDRHGQIAGLVRAFSSVALGCAGVLVVTGAIAAWRNIGSVAGLWQAPYGRLVLTKIALLAVAAGTGAYNWKRVSPTLGNDGATARLRTSATLELVAAFVVLVVTAVLVATPTPSETLEAMAP